MANMSNEPTKGSDPIAVANFVIKKEKDPNGLIEFACRFAGKDINDADAREKAIRAVLFIIHPDLNPGDQACLRAAAIMAVIRDKHFDDPDSTAPRVSAARNTESGGDPFAAAKGPSSDNWKWRDGRSKTEGGNTSSREADVADDFRSARGPTAARSGGFSDYNFRAEQERRFAEVIGAIDDLNFYRFDALMKQGPLNRAQILGVSTKLLSAREEFLRDLLSSKRLGEVNLDIEKQQEFMLNLKRSGFHTVFDASFNSRYCGIMAFGSTDDFYNRVIKGFRIPKTDIIIYLGILHNEAAARQLLEHFTPNECAQLLMDLLLHDKFPARDLKVFAATLAKDSSFQQQFKICSDRLSRFDWDKLAEKFRILVS